MHVCLCVPVSVYLRLCIAVCVNSCLFFPFLATNALLQMHCYKCTACMQTCIYANRHDVAPYSHMHTPTHRHTFSSSRFPARALSLFFSLSVLLSRSLALCNSHTHTPTHRSLCNSHTHTPTHRSLCPPLSLSRSLLSLYPSLTHSPALSLHVFNFPWIIGIPKVQRTASHCNTLQHTATHCKTLQHTATYCNTLYHTVTHCNTL